jgi:hypothetical protein
MIKQAIVHHYILTHGLGWSRIIGRVELVQDLAMDGHVRSWEMLYNGL